MSPDTIKDLIQEQADKQRWAATKIGKLFYEFERVHGIAWVTDQKEKPSKRDMVRHWTACAKAEKEVIGAIEELQKLALSAADALEKVATYVSGDTDAYRYLRLEEQQLINELRKASESL